MSFPQQWCLPWLSPIKPCLVSYIFLFPPHPGTFLTVPCLANFLITLRTVETGIPTSLEMALYPLEVLCLLIITLLMSSDSYFVFTIVTKERGVTDGFLKHGSHHSLANSCYMGTDILSQVILICDLPQVSHDVFPYWFTAKGANTSDTASFTFFYFFLPLFIVLNSCLSFALLYWTWVLYRKKMFRLIDIPYYVLKLHECHNLLTNHCPDRTHIMMWLLCL